MAREKVRVARCLGDLPRIDDALQRGVLSYSKVRAMTRVATADNEETLLELGLASTAAQLEKMCRLYRPIQQQDESGDLDGEDQKRWLRVRTAGDGMVRITVSLHPDEAARVLTAVDAGRFSRPRLAGTCGTLDSAEIRDGEPSRVDGLMALCDTALCDSAESGKPAIEAVVRVEVDAATLVGKLPDGTGVPAATSRRLLCDAGIVPLGEDERGNPLSLGRKRRTERLAFGAGAEALVRPGSGWGQALRRALQARDGGCQFPGCTNHRFTDAHHIVHWLDGGETNLEQMTLLCRRHHRFVHELGFSVERDGDRLVTFRDPRGRVVPASGERGLRQAAARERTRVALLEASLAIDATQSAPRWDGTHPDYALCIEALTDADQERDQTSGPRAGSCANPPARV